METLKLINYIIALLFTLCYMYQYLFIPVAWVNIYRSRRRRYAGSTSIEPDKKYAILISARNEANVISDLLHSINSQTYPHENITTFVVADNCTDCTAGLAEAAGAVVYTRHNTSQVGKGYALSYLMDQIDRDYASDFDGYFIFDADNILDSTYIEEMHLVFCAGNDIVTGYRNSKNYGSNWISAGYALWFLRESRYLNLPRHILGGSAAVSGTGFMFSRRIKNEMNGWKYHLLTEDIEFAVDNVLKGNHAAFAPKAILYDEQPVSFAQSCRQRTRWAKGYLQVMHNYGLGLLKGILHPTGHQSSFVCFDMSMTTMAAFTLSIVSLIANLSFAIWGAASGKDIMILVQSLYETFRNMYLVLFAIGAITTATEWNQIHTTTLRKLLYTVTFPIFMMTYIPISIYAIFSDTTWKPIEHTVSIRDIKELEVYY